MDAENLFCLHCNEPVTNKLSTLSTHEESEKHARAVLSDQHLQAKRAKIAEAFERIDMVDIRTIARSVRRTEVLLDNGTNRSSALFGDVCAILKIRKIWTSPYHSQGDGQVERFNRTLNNMLSHFVNENQDNWDTLLPLLSLAYNATFNYTIQQTPFYIMLSQQAPSLTDLLLRTPQQMETRWGGGMEQAIRKAYTAACNTLV